MHRSLSAFSDIRAVPLYKGVPHPQFIRASIHVVKHTPGLASFSWATAGLYDSLLLNILRILAPGNAFAPQSNRGWPLVNRRSRSPTSRSRRAYGLAQTLARRDSRTCRLDHVCRPPLSSLTISNTYHLDSPLLTRILSNTPKLKSLSITNCLRIEPCSLFSIITDASLPLESLTFTLPRDAEYDSLGATFPSLPTLRHLSVLIEPPSEPDPDRHTTTTDPLAQRLFRHLLKAIRNVDLYLALSAYSVADVLKHVSNLEQLSLELGGVLDDLFFFGVGVGCDATAACTAPTHPSTLPQPSQPRRTTVTATAGDSPNHPPLGRPETFATQVSSSHPGPGRSPIGSRTGACQCRLTTTKLGGEFLFFSLL
ncbi:hypothetical protein RHS01_08082 [Rhizoctonia solani]|uniref:F-box domain-containing protein n=1 Tax=Rhizoctonia solani TaxID=456999 RepID=A0A8H7IC91_9AGAM|nr:hypothetical protein RHS01_08082 [Rhizoctonia solani]